MLPVQTRTFGPILEPELRELFPDHAEPQEFSHTALRQMLQTWVDDVTKAESTLAQITDPNVKFHLKPALIQLDPTGNGEPTLKVEGPSELTRRDCSRSGPPPEA